MSNFSAFGGLSKEIFANYNNSEFAFLKDNIFLRNIKLNNLEILKMVSFLVRDKNWNNYDPKVLNSEEYKTKNDINFIFDLQYSDKLQKLIVKNKYIIKFLISLYPYRKIGIVKKIRNGNLANEIIVIKR